MVYVCANVLVNVIFENTHTKQIYCPKMSLILSRILLTNTPQVSPDEFI